MRAAELAKCVSDVLNSGEGKHVLRMIEPFKRTMHLSLVVLDSSFNPPTWAHISMLQHGMQAIEHAQGLFLLSVKNADKALASELDQARRLEMMCLLNRASNDCAVALCNTPLFIDKAKLIRRELFGAGSESMKERELWFVVGIDTLARILDPKYYKDVELSLQELFDVAGLIGFTRENYDESKILETEIARKYAHGYKLIRFDEDLARISSTQVREALSLKLMDRAKTMVPEEIFSYCVEHRMYQ
jgi:nicotinamide-nucleotide adenylyltransferase